MKTMKNIICLSLVTAAAVSCTFIKVSDKVLDEISSGIDSSFTEIISDSLEYSGNTVTIDSRIDNFDVFECNLPADIHFTQSDETSLRIVAPEYLKDLVYVSNKGNRLKVGFRKPVRNRKDIMTELWLSSPVLNEIELNGAGRFVSLTPVSADEFQLAVNGAVNFKLDSLSASKVDIDLSGAASGEMTALSSKELNLDIEGAGRVSVQGNSEHAELNVAGVGVIDARELECPDINTSVSGVGRVQR